MAICYVYAILLQCVFYSITQTTAFYLKEDNPMCTPNTSCNVIINHDGHIYTSQHMSCECRGNNVCPRSLALASSSRSVTRHIGTKESAPLLTLHYCEPLYTADTKVCGEDEVTMEFSGTSPTILTTVKAVYCRCHSPGPIYLSTSQIRGLTKSESYTCSMHTCNVSDKDHSCSMENVFSPQRVMRKVLCRCPMNHACRLTNKSETGTNFQCKPESHSA